MELYVLDVEGTQQEISLKGGIEKEIEKELDNLEEVLEQVDLGIEPTIYHVGNSFITSINNARWFKELNKHWIFSKIEITEM